MDKLTKSNNSKIKTVNQQLFLEKYIYYLSDGEDAKSHYQVILFLCETWYKHFYLINLKYDIRVFNYIKKFYNKNYKSFDY